MKTWWKSGSQNNVKLSKNYEAIWRCHVSVVGATCHTFICYWMLKRHWRSKLGIETSYVLVSIDEWMVGPCVTRWLVVRGDVVVICHLLHVSWVPYDADKRRCHVCSWSTCLHWIRWTCLICWLTWSNSEVAVHVVALVACRKMHCPLISHHVSHYLIPLLVKFSNMGNVALHD